MKVLFYHQIRSALNELSELSEPSEPSELIQLSEPSELSPFTPELTPGHPLQPRMVAQVPPILELARDHPRRSRMVTPSAPHPKAGPVTSWGHSRAVPPALG